MIKKILIITINIYQKYLSPDHSIWAKKTNRIPYCKYTPSCSDYMKEAIEKRWVIIWLTKWIWRIIRCNPWSKWWYDPVDKKNNSV